MPTYQFRAYDRLGNISSGELTALSTDEALSILRARQLFPFETREAEKAGWLHRKLRLPGYRQGLSQQDYATFMRALAVLLQADLPVDQSLKLVAGQQKSRAMRKFGDNLLASVVAGSTLSAALEKHAAGAPRVVPHLVRAGEARGNLAATLNEIARYLQASVEIRSKIRSALTYPLILAVVAIGTLAIIVGGLVPTLMPLFADNGRQPPFVLVVADVLTRFVTSYWLVCAVVIVGVFFWLRVLLRSPNARMTIDRFLLLLPFFGALARDQSTAVLARTLGTLLRNGVPLIASLQISIDAVSNQRISSFLRAAIEEVKAGTPLSKALRSRDMLPDLAMRFIEVGEESSRLDSMLLHLAELSENETQQRVDRAMTLIGPAMTIVIGAVIGTLVLSVMQAVLSVNELALR